MTKRTSWAIALTATTFLSAPAIASPLPPVWDNLNPENLSTSSSISWVEVDADQKDAVDVVAVQLPNKPAKYFQYTYTQPEGRKIYNSRQDALSGDINADFIGSHYEDSTSFLVYGGAVFNSGDINSINGNFIDNSAQNTSQYGGVYGATISNQGTIGKINGDFIGNYLIDPAAAYGSAISNQNKIGEINGNFIGNYYNHAKATAWGTVVLNRGTIDRMNADFIGNYAKVAHAYSIVYNNGTIGSIRGNFIGNYLEASGMARGGAIYNYYDTVINDINANFVGNYIKGELVRGGAMYNDMRSQIGKITGDFIGNHAEGSTAEEYALGGAVYTASDMTFTSGSDVHFMSENYTKDPTRGKIYNALFMTRFQRPEEINLTLDTTDGGTWVINDNIEGGHYDSRYGMSYDYRYKLWFTGDGSGTVWVNNDIVNAEKVTVNGTTLKFGSYQHEDQTAKNWDGKGAFVASLNADGTANRDAAAVTNLSLNNAVFDIVNGYLETVKLKGYSATDSFLHIDVDVENMKADELHVAGNVEGVTKMIVHASSNADIRNRGQILFAQSENDTTGNAGSFVVSRVYKSPYLFDVKYDQIAANSNKWYFEMNDEENPDKEVEPEEPDVPTPPTPDKPDIPDVPTPSVDYRKVAPEVIAYQGLPVAALEQTKGMVGNISRQVQGRRFYCPGCGFYDYYWNGEAFHNLWANAVYNTLRIKTPTDIDAEVWGLEAGGDLQHDLNNKLGLFLSYRKGNYDMNGDGKHHYSTIGSEIDIDSYLAGLYYRYDRNHWWTFATVYGGIQRVDLKTKDGIKSDTDGTEFGGSVELGYDYALNKTVYLTPSVGAFYTQVDYDDATDSAGKVAKYNTLRQLELEAGVKLTKAFVMDEGYANLYVKPSVVQTVTDGDEVRITGLGKVNTIDDQTLGRIELGGRYGFTEQLSAYGWANHTFGDDYKASTFGLGLSYSW